MLPGAEEKVKRDKSESDKRCKEPGRWFGGLLGEAVESAGRAERDKSGS